MMRYAEHEVSIRQMRNGYCWLENVKEGKSLEDLGIDEMIILTITLEQ
jgi:hypothetical protein